MNFRVSLVEETIQVENYRYNCRLILALNVQGAAFNQTYHVSD